MKTINERIIELDQQIKDYATRDLSEMTKIYENGQIHVYRLVTKMNEQTHVTFTSSLHWTHDALKLYPKFMGKGWEIGYGSGGTMAVVNDADIAEAMKVMFAAAETILKTGKVD